MGLEQKYRKSMTERWCLRFKTRLPEQDNYDGIITHNKRGFIVLRQEHDFEFDGVVLLLKKVIRGYRDNKYEDCCNAIIRQNGSLKTARSPRWLDSCDRIPDVFAQLQSRDIWPAIEIVFNEGSETAFYLGPITRIETNAVSIRCYDAAGKWEKVYELDYDEICRIEFDSKYCNHFNGYMRSKNDA